MAEVFEGELVGELGFTRKIAIKRMLADAAADPASAQRFLDEARIASRLHHANIVAVLDVGLLEGLPFQVLELVDGLDVQQMMQRAGGALPADIALVIAAEVARALDHAHAAVDGAGASLGIVHRDVKPSNVLVSWSGDVKLSDFGIALARDRESKTEAGIVAGTMGSHGAGAADARAARWPHRRVRARARAARDARPAPRRRQEISAEMLVLEGGPVAIDRDDAELARILAGALATDRLARTTAKDLGEQLDRLVSARVSRDRRAVLRDHLAPRAEAPGRRAGALDHLLGVELVEAPGPGGELTSYALRPRPADAATVHATPRQHEPEPPPPRRRGMVLAGAVGLAAIATAGGVAAWRVSARDAEVAAAAPPTAAPTAPPLAIAAPGPDAAIAVASVQPRVPRDAAAAGPTAVVDPAPTPMPVSPAHPSARVHRVTPAPRLARATAAARGRHRISASRR